MKGRMNMKGRSIRFTVTTKSNLFIGGVPRTFEIGGIDLFTATVKVRDGAGYVEHPFIPASSFKGALRTVIKDNGNDEIAKLYYDFLEGFKEAALKSVDDHNRLSAAEKADRLSAINKNYTEAIDECSAEYLFGIKAFNNTPKLIFNDLFLDEASISDGDFFSVDSKNTIETTTDHKPAANPRTYQSARTGLVFEGEIMLHQMEKLPGEKQDNEGRIIQYIKDCLQEFNSGYYRLGNSKSRGYGRIEIAIHETE
jgi:CRISPR-associated protein Csm3